MDATTLPFQRYLTALHQKYASRSDGAVATYIPELANADPAWFGICVVTADGYVYAVGDSDRRFTVQSISKPMVYAAALADRGREHVLQKVGAEPSGEAFNSISLHPQSGAPLNPMINAGAIATTGLVAGNNAQAQWKRIADVMATFFGRDVAVDDAVYRSESETGHRNRAIAWLLKNSGIIEGDPMPVLENYFRQCAVSVTCRDLAFMAATFANNGVHPVTGKRAVPAEDIEAVLSIMATCGMYDYAGSWLYDVGLPAKSGVSGGVIAVMPGRFGIAVFSPPLDDNGNSTRGLAVCRQISRDFRLHAFGMTVSPALVLSRVYSALDAPSRRVRTVATAYERIHIVLQREVWKVNHKRVRRLYRLEGLQVRMRNRRRKRLSLHRGPAPRPMAASERWSMDFVHDQLANGQAFRVFTVVDNWSRESVLLEAGFRLTGDSANEEDRG